MSQGWENTYCPMSHGVHMTKLHSAYITLPHYRCWIEVTWNFIPKIPFRVVPGTIIPKTLLTTSLRPYRIPLYLGIAWPRLWCTTALISSYPSLPMRIRHSHSISSWRGYRSNAFPSHCTSSLVCRYRHANLTKDGVETSRIGSKCFDFHT